MEDSVHSTKADSPSYDQLQDVLELCGNEERLNSDQVLPFIINYSSLSTVNSQVLNLSTTIHFSHCRIVTALPIYHNSLLHCRIVTKFYLSYHNLPLHCANSDFKFYLSTTMYLFTVANKVTKFYLSTTNLPLSLSNKVTKFYLIYHNLPLHCRIVTKFYLSTMANLPLHCRIVTKFYPLPQSSLFTVE
ncbi:hypothetical protein RRG08_055613 [Elysia crispata]|uniref:Uncharacterized protein n=1 Tax=Elysia crispata TaxID=231223 RepID=A0AAE0YD32_9GAST|nr:hypothetical protein RRG08_055613 [Elysia crispata]